MSSIETNFEPTGERPPSQRSALSVVRRRSSEMIACTGIGDLFDCTLGCPRRRFGIEQAMLLIRDRARTSGMTWTEITEIPYPGLSAPESQIALPILSGQSVLGVLFAEGPVPLRFRYGDEKALSLIADWLGADIPPVGDREASTPARPRRWRPGRGRRPRVTTTRTTACS